MKPERRTLLLLCALAALLGAPAINVPDSVGYYAWLHSLWFDFDLYFGDQLARYEVPPYWNHPTRAGWFTNYWAPGSALLWAPFFVLARPIAWIFEGSAGIDRSGYSAFDLRVIHAATLCLGALTLLLCARLCRRLGVGRHAGAATWLMVFGTPFAWYLLVTGSYAHVPSAFAVALLVYQCQRLREASPGALREWAAAGAALGLAGLVRWQELGFALLPALLALRAWRRGLPLRDAAARLGVAAGVCLLMLLPQLVAFRALHGGFLHFTHQGMGFDWLSPPLDRLLFSPWHGLFTWTPLWLPALAGLALFARRDPGAGLALLCCAATQLWIDAAFNWEGGAAFGVRRFVDCSALGVLGLATLLDRFPRATLRAGVACFAYTTLLAFAALGGALPLQEAVSGRELIEAALAGLLQPGAALRALFAGGVFGARPLGLVWLFLVSLAASAAGLALAMARRSDRLNPALLPVAASLALSVAFAAAALRVDDPSALHSPATAAMIEDVRAAEAALDAGEADPAAVMQLTDLYLRHGFLARAEPLLRQTLERHPYDEHLRVQLGVVLQQYGRLDEAETELRRVLTRRPEHGLAAAHLARVFEADGDREQACRWYERSATAPEPPRMGRVGHARCELERGRAWTALRLVRGVLAEERDHAGATALLRELERRYRGG